MSEWIKCSDRLPENPDEDVICYNTEVGIKMGSRLGSMRPYVRPHGHFGFDETTTHWMPLPEPPTD